jgi:hypothetical protein
MNDLFASLMVFVTGVCKSLSIKFSIPQERITLFIIVMSINHGQTGSPMFGAQKFNQLPLNCFSVCMLCVLLKNNKVKENIKIMVMVIQ